jgi:hypothetical protein
MALDIRTRLKSALARTKAVGRLYGGSAKAPDDLGVSIYIDTCSKFHRSLLIKGWMSRPEGTKLLINNIKVSCRALSKFEWTFVRDMPHLGAHAVGFDIQALLTEDIFPQDVEIRLDIDGVGVMRVNLDEINKHGLQHCDLFSKFQAILDSEGRTDLLDIGGRARSGILRADQFPNSKTEVLDVLPGQGVTIVCDAHRMSEVVGTHRFDAVMSLSVFEHLAMPWRVAVEINRIMKPGGVAFIQSHQTIGLHDLPWDFFRFSEKAWKALFNRYTGFEIVETQGGYPNFIIPFFWTPHAKDAERSAGQEYSAVLVRKISESTVDWPLTAAQITDECYPSTEEKGS